MECSAALVQHTFIQGDVQMKISKFVSLIILSLYFLPLSANLHAQEGFDDEEIIVFLKKIRDEDSNYLRDVTRATAKEMSRSGEFKARPYKRNSKGPVIEVSSPVFNFAKHKDGMSTKEIATATLSIASDIGSIFGYDKEAAQVDETNARINQNNALLDNWGDNEKVLVTMNSRVMLIDNESGAEISRTIKFEKVFNSKQDFTSQKEAIIQEAITKQVKKVLVEYLDDSGF
jgi:hypothetical protein